MNRRGNIPESNIQYSPAAVGIPNADRSGQILAEGVQNFAKGLMEREDKINTLSAMAKFGDFNAEFAKTKGVLQKQFRDSPGGYADAVNEAGNKLVTDFTKGMSNGVAAKFRDFTTPALAQDRDNSVGWAIQREKEIAVGDAVKSHADLTIAAEQATDPASLSNVLSNLDTVNTESLSIFSPKEAEDLKQTTKRGIIENSLSSAMLLNARKAYTDLAERKYAGIIQNAETEKLYIARAKNAMVNQAIVGQFNSLVAFSTEISTLKDQMNAGKVGPADINRRIEWAEINKNKTDANGEKVFSENYIRNLYTLRDMSLGLDARENYQKASDRESAIARFDSAKDRFLMGKPKIDGKTAPMSPKDYDEVLGLYADALSFLHAGVWDQGDFDKQKGLLDNMLRVRSTNKAIGTVDEALQNAGVKSRGWWEKPPESIFTAGYKIIRQYADSRTDLSETERVKVKDNLLVGFTDYVKKNNPEVVNNIKQIENYALTILQGDGKNPGLIDQLALYQHPETGEVIMFGQLINYQNKPIQFLGVDPKTKEMRYKLVKETVQGLENR